MNNLNFKNDAIFVGLAISTTSASFILFDPAIGILVFVGWTVLNFIGF